MKNIVILITMLFYSSIYSQDIITLKTGEEIKGKVIKVGVSEIEYKKDTASPVYAIKKSEVFMIKYENGNKDVLASLGTVEVKKPSVDLLQLKYQKPKRAGIGLLIADGLCMILGPTLLSVGMTNLSTEQYGTGYFVGGMYTRKVRPEWQQEQKTGKGCLAAGIICSIAILPFTIGGAVSIHDYVKYKKQWKEQQRSLSFAPNGMRLTF